VLVADHYATLTQQEREVMIYPRGKKGILWYKFMFNGVLYQKSTKQRSYKLAAAAEAQARVRLLNGFNHVPKRKAPMLFSAAAEEFVEQKGVKLKTQSIRSMHTSLTHLLPAFKGFVTDIDADQINRYIRDRKAEGASNQTVRIEMQLLRSVLIKHRVWSDLRPDVDIPPPTKSPGRALSWEEQGRLLAACAKSRCRFLYTLIALAVCTGLRYSELCSLRWAQIDLKKRILTVGETKTEAGSGREIPLNARAHAVLEHWNPSDRQPQHAVFYFRHDPMRALGTIKNSWKTARQISGVTCRFHDLRHTACTRMLEAGVPLSVVGELLGWSAAMTFAMAKRYGHIGQSARVEAVKALEGDDSGFGWVQNQIQIVSDTSDAVQ